MAPSPASFFIQPGRRGTDLRVKRWQVRWWWWCGVAERGAGGIQAPCCLQDAPRKQVVVSRDVPGGRQHIMRAQPRPAAVVAYSFSSGGRATLEFTSSSSSSAVALNSNSSSSSSSGTRMNSNSYEPELEKPTSKLSRTRTLMNSKLVKSKPSGLC